MRESYFLRQRKIKIFIRYKNRALKLSMNFKALCIATKSREVRD